MRPASIVQFERLFLAAAGIGLLGQLLSWNAIIASLRAQPSTAGMGPGSVIAVLALIYAVILLLWYFAARRHSVAAKWGCSIWFVVATVLQALQLLAIVRGGLHLSLAGVLGWLSYALLVWSVSYLFKPDADAWFASK